MSEHDPMQGVREYSERIGIPIDPNWLIEAQQIGDLSAQGKAQQIAMLDTDKGKIAAFVEKFNRFYPRFLQTLLGIGDVLITLTQTILIAFVVPLLLIGFIVVEQQRVVHGSKLWEVDDGLAQFGAWVLVIGNLIFELVANWQEHQAGYKHPPKTEFSFRVVLQRVRYMLGYPTDNAMWKIREKSPAYRARAVLRFITVAILMLAISGSMTDVIKATKGNWFEALINVLTTSTLLQFVTWLGGLLFALAVVLGAQALTEYISEKVVAIVAVMSSNVDDKAIKIAETAGLAMAAHLMTRLKEASKAKKSALATASAADFPMTNDGTKGVVRVTNHVTDLSLTGQNLTDAPEQGSMTKIDQAMSLLRNNRTLRTKTTRQLQEMYPEISRNTWSTARSRISK